MESPMATIYSGYGNSPYPSSALSNGYGSHHHQTQPWPNSSCPYGYGSLPLGYYQQHTDHNYIHHPSYYPAPVAPTFSHSSTTRPPDSSSSHDPVLSTPAAVNQKHLNTLQTTFARLDNFQTTVTNLYSTQNAHFSTLETKMKNNHEAILASLTEISNQLASLAPFSPATSTAISNPLFPLSSSQTQPHIPHLIRLIQKRFRRRSRTMPYERPTTAPRDYSLNNSEGGDPMDQFHRNGAISAIAGDGFLAEQELDRKVDSEEQELDEKVDSEEQELDGKIDSEEHELDEKVTEKSEELGDESERKRRSLDESSEKQENKKKKKRTDDGFLAKEDLTLGDEPVEKLLEPFTKEQLHSPAKQAAEKIRQLARPVPAPPPLAPAVSEYTQRKIFVSNVSAEIDPQKLLEFFKQFGEVEDSPLGIDKQIVKLKGFVFLCTNLRN